MSQRNIHMRPEGMSPPPGYSHVVVTAPGRIVFVSGQVSEDAAGQLIGKGDVAQQAEQVFANLSRALAAAGATTRDVVKITVFVTDAGAIAAVRTVRNRVFGTEAPPASTAVVVRALANPDWLVEVEAIAVLH